MNRRKFFSFIATAPIAAVVGAKAAMDANGNDVRPLLRGDFPPPNESELIFVGINGEVYTWNGGVPQDTAHNSRSQSLGS